MDNLKQKTIQKGDGSGGAVDPKDSTNNTRRTEEGGQLHLNLGPTRWALVGRRGKMTPSPNAGANSGDTTGASFGAADSEPMMVDSGATASAGERGPSPAFELWGGYEEGLVTSYMASSGRELTLAEFKSNFAAVMGWAGTIPREKCSDFAKQTLWQREVKLSGCQRSKLASYRGKNRYLWTRRCHRGQRPRLGHKSPKYRPNGERRKGSSDTPPVSAPASRRRCTDEGISAARVADPLTRAIVVDNYPDDPITRTQWLLLQEAVMGEMNKIAGKHLPEFSEPLFRRGAAIEVTKNVFSRDWMEGIVPKLSPWEGEKLKVVGLEALKKPHKAIITVPGRLDSKTIFHRIERLCSGLGTEQWRVLSEVPAKEGQDPITTLVLGLPESSVRKLRERDFTIASR
ncbi:hypothetical protein TKK_0017598 [Trichogramma kaykai]|uniref:DUF4780 domain-containing protein n=1 Tax=Trichogramma kaykai TaxID=54128 RepID=A0ABD2W2L8_9HYME